MNQEMPVNNNPPQRQEEETPAIMDTYNHLPCTTCGCNGVSTSSPASASHKSPFSHLPTPTLTHEPQPKKPNTTTTTHSHSLYGFSKIPLPTQETGPFLSRCSSDPHNPPISPVVNEIECPGTPLSKAIASAKLRRSVSDPTPSPAMSITNSPDEMGISPSPNSKWAKKMRDCMMEMSRKCVEILGFEEDTTPTEDTKNNSNNDATLMENSEEEYVEAVSVEKVGECLIIQFKCPCGQGHHIVLYGSNCYYKLV